MWRTFTLVAAVAFLLVSVAGNAVLYTQAAANAREAATSAERLKTLEQDRAALESRVSELNAENQRLRAAASTAANPAAPLPNPSTATVDPSILTRIEEQISALRGLPRKQDVPLRFVTREQLRAYLLLSIDRDYLPEERESDQKLYVTLGLIRPDENLLKIMLDLYQEQVLGFYDDKEKAMYVVTDGGPFGPAEKSTFAHEFTHALQDQSFDFQALRPPHRHNNDRYAAATAIAEGDAMLSERQWMQAHLTQNEINQASAGGDSAALNQAPLVVRTQLLFPYISGLDFIRRAYLRGNSFASVDAVFRDPPESTEQILHPDKYTTRDRPISVDLPDLAAAMGEGWRQIDSNVLGELDTRIAMEQFGDRSTAARAAAGWGGDRWSLLERDGRQAVVLKARWDTENDAREFFDTFGLALKSRFSVSRVEDESANRQALTAVTYATELRRGGRDTLVVISFDRPTAEALTRAVGGF